jgi:integrase
MVAVVRSFFQWLKSTGRITKSPFDDDIRNRIALSEDEIPIRAFTKEELSPILRHLRPVYRLMSRLALCTGLRAFEVTGLMIADLPSVDTSDYWVNLQVTRKGRRGKTLVQCPRRMVEELYHWIHLSGRPERARNARNALIAGRDDSRVFITEYGRAMAENRLTKEFTKAARKAGTYQRMKTLHGLRHTFGLTMLKHLVRKNIAASGDDGGINALLELRNLMGHRRIESTQRYLTALKLSQSEFVNRVNELYDSYLEHR